MEEAESMTYTAACHQGAIEMNMFTLGVFVRLCVCVVTCLVMESMSRT